MKTYIVTFKRKKNIELLEDMGATILFEYNKLDRIVAIESDDITIESIKALDEIQRVEEDCFDEVEEDEESSGQKESYAIEMLQAHDYWKRGITGKGVKVAVFDSGCYPHEDLKISGGLNGREKRKSYMLDHGGHGTHVVGIINMQDNDKGYVGIAPDAKAYVIKLNTTETGGFSIAAQIAGINWCIDRGIDIVNCSFSGENDNVARNEAFFEAYDKGVIIVAAAANSHNATLPTTVNTIKYPAKYPFVQAVAAINEKYQRRATSACGKELDFSAPGDKIISTIPEEGSERSSLYGSKSGTSMASPYVAGLFALYKQMFPYLDNVQLIEKMKDNTQSLGLHREYGLGLPLPPEELYLLEDLSQRKEIKVRSGITIRDHNMNAVAQLENAYNVSYEREANSIWQASFSLPLNDPKVKMIDVLKYVEIVDDINDEYVGLFRVMPKLTRKNSEANYVTFECEHVLSTLLDSSLFKYHQLTNFDTTYVLNYLINRQNHKHWQLGKVEFTRYFHYSWENENVLSALLSVPKPFDEPYIFTFDTQNYPWTLNLVKPSMGVVSRIKEGYNLRTIEIEENPMSSYNRIYPLGAGEGVNQLTIESVNNGVPYLEDRKPGEEIREIIWPDQRYTHAESLKADAQAMLDKRKTPKMTWVASAADVSSITGLSIDKLKQGNVVRMDVEGFPKVDLRIMKEKRTDITGDPGNVELEIGNVVEDLGATNADLERRQQINELYSQGATNIMNFTYQDNCDANIPATIPFYIDDDVVNINTIELTFMTKNFRAYSQATKGGGAVIDSTKGGGGIVKATKGGGGTTRSTTSGGSTTATSSSGGGTSRSTNSGGGSSQTSAAGGDHRHLIFTGAGSGAPPPLKTFADANGSIVGMYSSASNLHTRGSSGNHSHAVSIPNHSHEFSTPNHTHSVTIPAHSHNVTIPDHTHEIDLPNHTHEIELPDHKHDVEHKIVELSSLPSKVTIKVDGNTVPHDALSGDRINLVDYMSKDSTGRLSRGRHEVTIQPDGLARIEADLICRVFIQSQLGNTY